MIKQPRIIRQFTRDVDALVNSVAMRLESSIADEDDFTSRLLERMEMKFDDWSHAGISLRVEKLTSKGAGAEEAEFGADIVATVSIRLREYRADKGILVQAKRLRPGRRIDAGRWKTLSEQIEKMHAHTNEAYVWIYDKSGVRSVKSATLLGVRSRRPNDLYLTRCGAFLGELIQCKHGDSGISGTRERALMQLRERYAAKSAIGLLFHDGDEHD